MRQVTPRDEGVTGIRTHEQKITFGEMRASGVRDVLIYCVVRCSRHIEVNADDWPENVRLSDVSSPRFTCTRLRQERR